MTNRIASVKMGRGYGLRDAERLEFSDAVRMAVEKPEFAHDLVENPAKYEHIFNLSPEHVKALKAVRPEDFADMGKITDPKQFAECMAATEAFLSDNIGDLVKMREREVYD